MKRLIVLGATLLFWGAAFADGNKEGSSKEWEIREWCNTIQIEHFMRAYHPGEQNRKKVENGTLNEDTPGTGLKCIAQQEVVGGHVFFHVGELINSQYRETTVLSMGYEYELFTYDKFSLVGAIEAAHLEYGMQRYDKKTNLLQRKMARGWAPLPSISGLYKLDSTWSVGARMYVLPKGGIKEYSIFLQREF